MIRTGADDAYVRATVLDAGAERPHRGAALATGSLTDAGQPAGGADAPGPRRRGRGHDLRARGRHRRAGRAERAAVTSSTTHWRCSTPAPARCSRTSPACCASAARSCASCAGGSTPRSRRRSTYGTSGWPRSATTSPRAAVPSPPRSDPEVAALYRSLADETVGVRVAYAPSWAGGLAEALARRARRRRAPCGVSTVGPHRDDVTLTIDGRDARTQSSQGEQRSLALALRIAVHERVTRTRGRPPLLLLGRRLLRARRRPCRRDCSSCCPSARPCSRRRSPPPPGLHGADVVDVAELHDGP